MFICVRPMFRSHLTGANLSRCKIAINEKLVQLVLRKAGAVSDDPFEPRYQRWNQLCKPQQSWHIGFEETTHLPDPLTVAPGTCKAKGEDKRKADPRAGHRSVLCASERELHRSNLLVLHRRNNDVCCFALGCVLHDTAGLTRPKKAHPLLIVQQYPIHSKQQNGAQLKLEPTY